MVEKLRTEILAGKVEGGDIREEEELEKKGERRKDEGEGNKMVKLPLCPFLNL